MILTGIALAALVATGWALYQKGKDTAQLEAEAASLRSTLSTLETVMNVQDLAIKNHTARTADDAKNARLLNERIKSLDEYVESFGQVPLLQRDEDDPVGMSPTFAEVAP